MYYQREHHFSSFDEFNSAPHGWQTDFYTTSQDCYQVSLKQSVAPGLLVNTAWLSAPTLQRASTPEGMRTFALPLRQPGPYCWRGLPVNERTLMVFPSDRELFSVMGADSEIMTISIDQHTADSILENWEIDPRQLFKLPRTIDLSDAQCVELGRNLNLVTEFMLKYGDHQQFPRFSRGIQEHLVENMLRPVIEELDQPGTSQASAAKRVKKAASYVLARLAEPVTVGDICNHVGCSRRSLEQSFSQYAGTSPKQFIQALRLERCRKALLRATPDDKVSRIASRYGFWHMGQFALSYRRLFGEIPSRTLQRVR
jgi:AraC family ethanolamine operon transcriptional activator